MLAGGADWCRCLRPLLAVRSCPFSCLSPRCFPPAAWISLPPPPILYSPIPSHILLHHSVLAFGYPSSILLSRSVSSPLYLASSPRYHNESPRHIHQVKPASLFSASLFDKTQVHTCAKLTSATWQPARRRATRHGPSAAGAIQCRRYVDGH